MPILGNIIFDYDYIKAKKDKVISDFKMINAYAPMLDDEVEEYEKITTKIAKRVAMIGYLDNSDSALKNLLFKRSRIVSNSFNRIPLGIKLINSVKAYKWIVFTESKKQARLFNQILSKNYRSAIYNTDLSIASRHKNIRNFKLGIIDILITCKALDEGFDYPEVDANFDIKLLFFHQAKNSKAWESAKNF